MGIDAALLGSEPSLAPECFGGVRSAQGESRFHLFQRGVASTPLQEIGLECGKGEVPTLGSGEDLGVCCDPTSPDGRHSNSIAKAKEARGT